ncbi:ABC transporter ATP-binding protein [Slackia faecicanis]|uniref:ABC transporter ATP-binding protein n=1 Tax=Slackia faecicanis TaxID=255723 RepID=A0A3N0AIB0_9ACTN|nr:ABC transporter ATP-binding protein [Slackia faecicanis]RNL21560.1 ABC transporter ATP-binding protein [Slackia faecicanis]
MRIIRYLKESKAAVALVIVLLIAQAFADLSLPRLTSDLVDVGIQQAGVEDAAPEAVRSSMFEALCMLAPAEDESFIRACYEQADDGTCRLNEQGEKRRDELDERIATPFALAYFAQTASAREDLASDAPIDLDALTDAYAQGAVSKDDVLAMADAALSAVSGADESLVAQQAVSAAKAEYEQLGYDMDSMQMRYLLGIGGRMLAVAALMTAAAIAVGYIASRTAAGVAKRLRERLFAKVLSFSDADVQKFSAASLITRATNDIQQIQMVVTVLLRMVLYAPILAIGGIVMVSRTDASMSWIIVVAVAAIFATVAVLMGLAMPKFKVMQKLIDRVNLVSREILTGLPVIRAFGRQEYEEGRFDQASTALMRTQLFTNRVMTFMMPAMMLVMNAVSVLIVWVGGFSIDAGTIQTGDMIAFITYSMVIIMSFLMLGMVSIMLPRADVAAKRVNEVLAAPCSIADPAEPESLAEPRSEGVEIVFDDVTFSYDEESDPVLSHVSFTAEAGKTTAVIGSTGSGKSTVIKLVERFYDVDSGSVRVDGVDVRAMAQHDLRAQFGYVPQKAFLFSGTIADTVGYSDPSMGEERMRAAVELAQAADFVAEREEGMLAPVAQGGSNVSGGQRQRLSIARALAADVRAYLFDDSFSALDYKTDARLRAAIAEGLRGKTVLIVAQRISTVLTADRIVVLENGSVAGCGTHDELMRTCETYREIALSQLSEEELKGGGSL